MGSVLGHRSEASASFGPHSGHYFAVRFAPLKTLPNSRLRGVVLRVLDRIHDQQILNAVVGSVMVQVVNVLARAKQSTDVLLHHVAMLSDVALSSLGMGRHSKHDVAKVVHVSTFAPFHPVAVVAGDEAMLCGGHSTSTTAGTQRRRLLRCYDAVRSGVGQMVSSNKPAWLSFDVAHSSVVDGRNGSQLTTTAFTLHSCHSVAGLGA